MFVVQANTENVFVSRMEKYALRGEVEGFVSLCCGRGKIFFIKKKLKEKVVINVEDVHSLRQKQG